MEYTPFPDSVCRTLYPNPCMKGCTRSTIDDGIFIAAEQVIFSIGEAPSFEFLPKIKKFRSGLVTNTEKKINCVDDESIPARRKNYFVTAEKIFCLNSCL